MNDQAPNDIMYDLPTLIDGAADSIIAKLADLTAVELSGLADLEGARQKPRKTVLDAIAAELEGRVGDAGAEIVAGAGALDVILPAAGDPDLAQARAKIGALEQQLAARDARIAELVAAVDELQGKTGMVATPAPKALALPKKPQAPVVDDYAVVFGDSAGRTITSIKPLQFGAEQFAEARGALKLLPKIEFGRDGAGEEVCSAWLVKGTKPVARCEFMTPIAVRGGRMAVIPAGYLAFRA